MPYIPNLSSMKDIINSNVQNYYEQLTPSKIGSPHTMEEFFDIFTKSPNTKRQPAELVQINDESSVIMVVDADNFSMKHYTDKFYLTAFQEARNEKVQVVETFGDPNVSFFGERAKTYQGAGIVLEADSSNRLFPEKYRWASSLSKFYDEELRGSELVRKNRIAVIYVGNYRLQGYFLNLILSTNANDSYKKQFSFNFLVKKQELVKKESLDILFSLYQVLSPSDRATFMQLEQSLKDQVDILRDINLRLLEINENIYFEHERKLLNKKKSAVEDIIAQTIDDMRYILTKHSDVNLDG